MREPDAAREDPRTEIEDEDREASLLASDRVLIDEFLDSFGKESLPRLPNADPKFHYCWLTTTNPRDPVIGRLRLGYELVKTTEFPELHGYHIMSGTHAGSIGVNEMLLAKLPMARYQRLMSVVHHDRPRQEEAGIKARVNAITADVNARRGIANVATLEPGYKTVEDTRRQPRAFD